MPSATEGVLAEARSAASAKCFLPDRLRFTVVAVYMMLVAAFLLITRRVRFDVSVRDFLLNRLYGRPRPVVPPPSPECPAPPRLYQEAPPSVPPPLRADRKAGFECLVCPQTGQRLERIGDALVTPDRRHSYPIVREVPRFVSSDNYVRSFSFEWNVHNRTQLDTYRDDGSSEQMFREKTGLTPEDVRGKRVLDAGIGAGRFADVLARWGANVIGVDLSYAVEAANANFGHLPNVLVCQADIGKLPFRPGTFDYIISIGVLHHTPNTRQYFAGLPRLLKPGGEIAIWVYPQEGEYVTRNYWIPFTNRIPKAWFYSFCKVFVPWALRRRRARLVRLIQRIFPFSDQRLGVENDVLDTFDGYSPRYHGIHQPEEVKGWFRDAGLADLKEYDWHTAVRGRRPAA